MNTNNIINNTKKVNMLREKYWGFFALGIGEISPIRGK
jgi:hypothetical protein